MVTALNNSYNSWYDEFKESMDSLGQNDLARLMDSLLKGSGSTVSLNRKLMEKAIDVSWVEAIENGIVYVDNVVRNPSRTIIDVEEIVPIALSKKITVESVKHLAQHTDLIQSIDKKTGKITPSKILNIHKEESLATYENRFVNTLIDRLYIFIMTRYEKLSQVSKDEELYTLDFDTEVEDASGQAMRLKLSIDTTKSLETKNDQGYTIWQRVEKLKKAIEGYKGSELCQTLGKDFVRPPIMRTNAIMKNVDLKGCLTLWQYILGYENAGYEINIEDTALKPEQDYLQDMYRIVACNLLLFKSYMEKDEEAGGAAIELGTKKLKPVAPKVVKKYGRELLTGNYELHADEAVGYVAVEGEQAFVKTIPEDSDDIFEQINKAIEIERNYYAELEEERQAKIAAEEEAERRRQEREARLEEKRRIEEAKREERERIKREKEEEAKRIQEMLEKRRLEMEAEERERARLEAERLARLEEKRRLEEEARKKREEEERIAAEKARIAEQKSAIRTDLADAAGYDAAAEDKKKEKFERETAYSRVTGDEIEEAVNAMEEVKARKEAEEAAKAADQELLHNIEENFAESAEEGEESAVDIFKEEIPEQEESTVSEEEIEVAAAVMKSDDDLNDPRTVAARMKVEQQKREKERREEERAQRLKAERQFYEQKPVEKIFREYSRNPIYVLARLFMKLLFIVFGYIPKNTDNPDYKRILAERAHHAEEEKRNREEREHVEVYYRKYAPDTKYRIRRDIADIKFKLKKRKEAKNKPKPAYTPPKRTAEETAAINKQMKELYKKYRVSLRERIRRKLKSMTKAEKERELKQALGER